MKKLIASIFALLLLVSCSTLPEPDAHELANKIISGQSSGRFEEADGEMISVLLDLNVEDFSDHAIYYSSEPACADIVIIFKTDDKELLDSVKEILEDFRNSRIEDFKGYAPEEAAKLEESKTLAKGKYVILSVLPDKEAAQDTINTAFE